MRKYFSKIAFFSLTTVPLIVVSCSTTWTKWEVDQDAQQTETKFKNEISPNLLWEVRSDQELMKAWDANSSTLMLNKINNQYELLAIIGKILKIKSYQNIAQYWNNYTSMSNYLNNLNTNANINLLYKEADTNIIWNIDNITTTAVNFLNDPAATPGFDIGAQGVGPDGTPIDFQGVANYAFLNTNDQGVSFLGIPSVLALTTFDSGFALELSKLVNLPLEAYKAFIDFMLEIDNLIESIFNSEQVIAWVLDKKIDFKIGPTGNLNTFNIPENSSKSMKIMELMKGQFLIRSLKN